MSPRTEKQFEAMREAKRGLIMQHALELFASRGFESTSIGDIAEQAGISKGLLYHYFESKEELLLSILHQGFDEMLAVFDPNKDGILETDELAYFIHEMFTKLIERRNFWRLYFAVSLQTTVFGLIEKRIDEILEPMNKMVTSYFKQAGFNNPQMEAILFASMLDGIAFDYVMKPDLVPIKKIEKELIKRYCCTK
jgi:AcrR family transcriptional regulator